MTPRRRVIVLVSALCLLVLAPFAPASATPAVVSVQDFSFTPAAVTVGMGETVTWVFSSMHTTTSNQRFWNSGHRDSGAYVITFRDAGTFGYHCSMHPSMTGRVTVPMRTTGSAATGWRLTWSTRTTTPASRRFDVQFRRIGTSTWSWFRHGSAKRVGHFDPARPGQYVIRSRTRNVGVGVSGWSPRLTVSLS